MKHALILIALMGTAVGQPADNRLTLLVFKTPECPPCRAWKAAYDDLRTGFCVELNRRYRMKDAIVVSSREPLIAQYNITRVPTFVLTDAAGREVHRVERFTSPAQLLQGLAAVRRQPQRSVPQVSQRPPIQQQQAPIVADTTKEILKDNEWLRQTVDALERERQVERERQAELTSELAEEIRRADKLKQLADLQATNANASIDQVKAAAERRIAELTQQIKLSQRPEATVSSAECENGVCTIPAQQPVPIVPKNGDKSRGIVRTILHHGMKLALDFGLTQAQSELIVPVVAGGGPTGIAAGAAFLLFRAWKRKRGQGRARASPGSQRIVVDAPQPASTEVIETQIVNVESDNYRRAHEKARQQVARRYPGSQEILEAELSLTHQYLAGQ